MVRARRLAGPRIIGSITRRRIPKMISRVRARDSGGRICAGYGRRRSRRWSGLCPDLNHFSYQRLDLSAGADPRAVVFRRIVFRARRVLLARRHTIGICAARAMLREQRLPYRAGVREGQDSSRNVHWLAVMHFFQGENWHRNHHSRPGLARLGWNWHQPDAGYVFIRGLEKLGFASDVRDFRQLRSLSQREVAPPNFGLNLKTKRPACIDARGPSFSIKRDSLLRVG